MLSSSQVREKARTTLTADISKPLLLTLIFSAVSMGIVMVLTIISSLFSMLSFIIPVIPVLVSIVVSLAATVVLLLFYFGYYQSLMKIHRNEEFSYGDVFKLSIDNLKRNIAILWQTVLKLWLPILLMVIAYVVFMVSMILVGIIGGLIAGYADSDLGAAIFVILLILVSLVGMAVIIASYVFFYIRSLRYTLTYFISYDNPNMTPKEVVEESEKLMKNHIMDLFKLQLSFIGWALLASLTGGIGVLFLTPYMVLSYIVFYEDRLVEQRTSVSEE